MTPPPTPALRRFAPDRTALLADPLLVTLGVVAGGAAGALLGSANPPDPARSPIVFGAFLVGLLVPRLHWNRYRTLGFVPYAATASAGVAALTETGAGWQNGSAGMFCLFLGIAVGAVLRFRDGFRAGRARFFAATAIGVALATGVVVLFVADRGAPWTRWFVTGTSAVLAVQAWWTCLRPWVEFTSEMMLWVMYRVEAQGPGFTKLPQTGPCLIIANHAAWFDPLFLSKALDRPNTPVMTERFFNIWFLKPLLKYVIRVIVVPETPIKRDAPEVREAIAALDAGHCVVLFPEGYLRRREDQILRRFGQGVWQILSARPETPMIACWIEGGWGSYVSYHNGPPTKNKRFDFGRRIAIGASAPEVVPAEVLKEQLPARIYLMNRVLAAREHIGLPIVPPIDLPKRDEATDDTEGR